MKKDKDKKLRSALAKLEHVLAHPDSYYGTAESFAHSLMEFYKKTTFLTDKQIECALNIKFKPRKRNLSRHFYGDDHDTASFCDNGWLEHGDCF